MVKKQNDLPRALTECFENGHQEQEAVKKIIEEERSELRKKQEKNELTIQDFDYESKVVESSIKALKDKIVEIATVLSGEFVVLDLNRRISLRFSISVIRKFISR